MLIYAAVLLLAPLVAGQVEKSTKPNDLAKLKAFMGNWEATDITATASWKPVLDGRFIEHRFMLSDSPDEPGLWLLVMIGQDPADQQVKFWAFHSDGACSLAILSKSEGKDIVLKSEGTDLAGSKRQATVTFVFPDKDSYKWTIRYADGENAESTFKRAGKTKGQKWPGLTVETPQDASEQLKDIAWWAARCSFEGNDAFTGKTTVGQSTCDWTLNGKFLLYDIVSVEPDLTVGRYRAVIGVDPSTNKTTGWEFDALGTVGKYTVSDKGQDIVGMALSPKAGNLEYKGRMTRTDTGMEYRATGKLPEGKETSIHGIWKKHPAGK